MRAESEPRRSYRDAMSDDLPDLPDDGDELPQEPPVEVFDRQDDLLDLMVRLANKTRMEIPVTLTVRGVVVKGMLASGADFFPSFGERFASNFGDAGVEIRRSFDGEALKYTVPGHVGVPVRFIHVKNAIVDGETLPFGGWWRGQIDRVDGWSFGYQGVPG